MAEIIRLDTTRRRPPKDDDTNSLSCRHKNVTAWTVYRTVNCSICGAELDPFDVLVDMIKGYIPANGGQDEELRFGREAARREDSRRHDDTEPE